MSVGELHKTFFEIMICKTGFRKTLLGEVLSFLSKNCKTELIKEDVDLHGMDNTPPSEFSALLP